MTRAAISLYSLYLNSESLVKMFASKSYQIGPYTVRRDAGARGLWRVFVGTANGSVSIYTGRSLAEASAFAHQISSVTTRPTLVPANGGTEQPFTTRSGRCVLYVFDIETGTHRYLDLGTDMLLPRDFSPLTDGTETL